MRNTTLLMATVVAIVGVVLVIFEGRGAVLSWVVEAVGVMFIIPGFFVLLSQVTAARDTRNSAAIITSIGCVCLGLCLCLLPQMFVGMIIYVFAFTLVFGGIWQLVNVARYGLPWPLYIIPTLVAATGLIMVFSGTERDASAIVLVTGIAMIVYSANVFLEYYKLRRYIEETR